MVAVRTGTKAAVVDAIASRQSSENLVMIDWWV